MATQQGHHRTVPCLALAPRHVPWALAACHHNPDDLGGQGFPDSRARACMVT